MIRANRWMRSKRAERSTGPIRSRYVSESNRACSWVGGPGGSGRRIQSQSRRTDAKMPQLVLGGGFGRRSVPLESRGIVYYSGIYGNTRYQAMV